MSIVYVICNKCGFVDGSVKYNETVCDEGLILTGEEKVCIAVLAPRKAAKGVKAKDVKIIHEDTD